MDQPYPVALTETSEQQLADSPTSGQYLLRVEEWDKSLYERVNRRLGIKRHVCGYCGKRCMTPAELVRHERIHTGEKPFECQHCDKKFALKHSLTVHTLRNHYDAPT